MNSDRVHLLRMLPYAGAAPFVAGSMLTVLQIQRLPFLGATQHILLTYGLLIVSFMAGVQWGQYLAGARASVNLLVSSNVMALLAWFGFLLLPAFWFSLLLIFLFATLYVIDTQFQSDVEYLKTRRNVTALVCLSLLVATFA